MEKEDAWTCLCVFQTLDLSGNMLSHVPPDLPESLEFLHLQNNRISSVSATAFLNTPNIKGIFLRWLFFALTFLCLFHSLGKWTVLAKPDQHIKTFIYYADSANTFHRLHVQRHMQTLNVYVLVSKLDKNQMSSNSHVNMIFLYVGFYNELILLYI